MAFFAKKEPEPLFQVEQQPVRPPVPETRKAYGIADAIQLMRTLPVDQNGELVIRVVRATLGSLNVRLPQIIEDGARKQKTTQERIAGIHAQIASLEKQLEGHRQEITALEADLKETTEVKERLESAEMSASKDGLATVQMAAADQPDSYVRT
jgi:septal ring factor EnvC (AmiA/AmiB activator)